jgi:hypothetical protein
MSNVISMPIFNFDDCDTLYKPSSTIQMSTDNLSALQYNEPINQDF